MLEWFMSLGLMRRAQFTFWRYAEWRAVFEWHSFYLLRLAMKKLPKGDGHPVIVFPGFGGSDRSTLPLRGLFDDLGYSTHGWGLGSNLLFDNQLEAEMAAMVAEIYERSGQKVSLIGWSLGGLYAREVAKICPDKVRCVITMGSPISGNAKHSNAHKIFRMLNGDPTKIDVARYQNISEAPPVPTSSIYSKTDGIVAWEGSIQKLGVQTENIAVPASHLGIGVNPLTMYLLADRLSQPLDAWKPFKANRLMSLVFKKH